MHSICTLCNSNLNTLYLKKNKFNKYSVNILKCNNCNHKFQELYEKGFKEEYYSYYLGIKNNK